MATGIEKILGEALKLGADDRARVVAELLATLEPDVPSQRRSDQEWIAEIERRARAAMSGDTSVGWSEAKGLIQSRLSSR